MWDPAARPPVALGHVFLKTTHPEATIQMLLDTGFHPIVTRDDFAVLELRGGTHLVVRGVAADEQPEKVGWDIMVDDIDQTHADYTARGWTVSPIRRGQIHDNFNLTLPDGRQIEINSSHAGDRIV